MATDFTFIFGTVQKLTKGRALTQRFRTPNVDTRQGAVLMFHARAVEKDTTTLQINGQNVGNGVPSSPSPVSWTGHVLLVNSGVLTGDRDNVLEVEPLDEFFMDNCVIFYKTR